MAYCIENGGVLAEPTNSLIQSILKSLIDGKHYWWIGATDAHSEGNFVWLSGTPWSYTNWNGGEPNNSGDEDCVHLREDGKWNDLPCASTFVKPLCQRKGQ